MHEKKLKKLFAPDIWFRRQFGDHASFSKLGGLPNLPANVAWPRRTGLGTPLHFLAQVNLSELPRTPLADDEPALPESGFLFFFADMEEEMLWNDGEGPFSLTRVIYTNETGSNRRPPSDIPEVLHAEGERAGGYNTGMTTFPSVSIKPHIIDTFGGVASLSPHTLFDTYSAAAQAAMVASMERAIGASIPVFTGPDALQSIKFSDPK